MADNTPYIPGRDSEALLWMEQFASGIAADVGAFQLTASDAATITAAVQAFADALAVTTSGGSRTPQSIVDKDEARQDAEQLCRQYASLIKFNAGIGNGLKVAIGVRPVNVARQPIEAPSTSPIVNIVAATPGLQTLRFADSMTPNSRRKPFGSTLLALYVHVADEPTVDEDVAQLFGNFTRNPIAVAFSPDDDGKMATYFARWVSAKGEAGPWSLPVSMRIAA